MISDIIILMGGIGSGKGIRLNKWRKKNFTHEIASFDSFMFFSQYSPLKSQVRALPVTSTPCNFGGQKHYWLCPKCQRRCRFMYYHSGMGGCRLCFRLAYKSQNETLADRLLRKKEKLQSKLQSTLPFPERPKYMRKRVFADVCHQISNLDQMAMQAFLTSARKMQGMSPS